VNPAPVAKPAQHGIWPLKISASLFPDRAPHLMLRCASNAITP
jgi:hypothetical protein